MQHIDVWPNPTRNNLTINNAKGGYYKILNLYGALVQEGNVNSNTQQLDLKNTQCGNYLVQVMCQNQIVIKNLTIH
jgi:hypothetical protein